MTAELLTVSLGLAFVALASSPSLPEEKTAPAAHTRTEFRFTVDAPFEEAAPLFGADEERKWAPGWDPQFVYPAAAKDQQGSVFRVAHGHYTSVWTTTAFDLAAGHVQYVYVINDAMVTLIDIHLSRQDTKHTAVSVVYERTALAPEANDHVAILAKQDEGFGKEWELQINGYLEKARAH